MSDIVERAKAALDVLSTYDAAPLWGIVPELIAEVEGWRQLAEDEFGVDSLAEAEMPFKLAGLSIVIGAYGEWGREPLEVLFDKIGMGPGDNLLDALELIERMKGQ